MAVLKGYIEASGLSRLYQHLSNYHCATISACRGYTMDAYIKFRDELDKGKELQNIPEAKAYKLTASQNKVRHKDLGNRLHRDPKFTGITQINGVFQEKGSDEPSLEVSYIVFCDDYNYLWDNITALGTLYEQDSVCVVEQGAKSGAEVKTSPDVINAYPEYRQYEEVRSFRGVAIGYREEWTDKDAKAKIQEFFSSVKGRPFHFKEIRASSLFGIKHIFPNRTNAEYRQIVASIKGLDYLIPVDKLTTKGGVFSAFCVKGGENKLQRQFIESCRVTKAEKPYFEV